MLAIFLFQYSSIIQFLVNTNCSLRHYRNTGQCIQNGYSLGTTAGKIPLVIPPMHHQTHCNRRAGKLFLPHSVHSVELKLNDAIETCPVEACSVGNKMGASHLVRSCIEQLMYDKMSLT